MFDKLLITYWEKPRFLFTDTINHMFMRLVQVAVVPSLMFAAIIANNNNCQWAETYVIT